jgi:hypothetical protein
MAIPSKSVSGLDGMAMRADLIEKLNNLVEDSEVTVVELAAKFEVACGSRNTCSNDSGNAERQRDDPP